MNNTPAKPAAAPTIVTAVPQGGQYVLPYISTTWTLPNNFDGYAGSVYHGAICAGSEPSKKVNKDGCRCTKCKEFYPYAEANQNDGTLICYPCRKRL